MERKPNRIHGSEPEGRIHQVIERLFHRSSLDGASIDKESKAKAMERHIQPTLSNANKSPQNSDEDEEYTIHKPIALTILAVGLALTIFVVGLDDTIIAAAVPTITTTFHSLHDIGWYASAYLITSAALQPAFGKIYTHFHITYTFLFSMLVFVVGSAVCGAAQTSRMLIIGRAVAGAGSAGLFSGGLIIVGFAVPLRYRALWFAVLSSMYGITALIGPVLGGAITERISWRWCFYINLPICTVAALTVWFSFTHPTRKSSSRTTWQKLKQIDILGAAVLVAAMVCLVLALQRGGVPYSWNHPKVVSCLVCFAALIVIFVVIQFMMGGSGSIPLRMFSFRQRTVLASALFSGLTSMALFVQIYYLPFYFQSVRGMSAIASGVRTIPYLASSSVVAVMVGGAISVCGYYAPFAWIGSAVFCIGAGMLTTLKLDSSPAEWIGYQVIAGAGAGSCIQIPLVAVQAVLSKEDLPVGSSITIFFGTLGGAVSTSMAENIFATSLIDRIPKEVPDFDPHRLLEAGATQIKDIVPKDSLQNVLRAFNTSVTNVLSLAIIMSGFAFFASLLFEWTNLKRKQKPTTVESC